MKTSTYFDIKYARASVRGVHNRLVEILTTSPETPIGEVAGEIGRLIALNAFYSGMVFALERNAGASNYPANPQPKQQLLIQRHPSSR